MMHVWPDRVQTFSATRPLRGLLNEKRRWSPPWPGPCMTPIRGFRSQESMVLGSRDLYRAERTSACSYQPVGGLMRQRRLAYGGISHDLWSDLSEAIRHWAGLPLTNGAGPDSVDDPVW
jgi:hypothetical protein